MASPAPAESDASSPPPATDPLTDLLKKLSDEVESLRQNIAAGRTAAEDAVQQQRWVRSALTDLQRVEDVFADVRAEADQAGADAEKAVADVQGRIDALSAAERAALQTGITEIDKTITDREGALRTAEQELATRRGKARDAEAEVERSAGALRGARDALTGVSDRLKELVSALRRLTSRIGSAARADQNRRVYVLSVDIGALRGSVKGLLDEDEHNTRVTAYDDARKALAEARKSHAAAEKAVAEQEGTVVAQQRALDKARARRPAALDTLIAQTE